MSFFLKPKLGRLSLLFVIANALAFLVFYIPNYVVLSEPMAITYLRIFLGEAVSFLIIPLSVTFIYYEFIIGARMLRLVLSALALVSTKCTYNLLYYYLFETALGYDWIESTLSSIGISILIVAVDLSLTLLLSFGAIRLAMLLTKKRSRDDFSKEHGIYDSIPIMTMQSPWQVSFFAASAAIFLYNIIIEIIDIANHLAEYGEFRSSELIFVVSKLVFFVILLLISYVLQCLLYNYYRKAQENDQTV